MLCQERQDLWKAQLFWESSSPLFNWIYTELSLKSQQSMKERPFFEAKILMLVCLYFPYDMLPGAVSSVLAVRESKEEALPVPGSIVLRRRICSWGLGLKKQR